MSISPIPLSISISLAKNQNRRRNRYDDTLSTDCRPRRATFVGNKRGATEREFLFHPSRDGRADLLFSAFELFDNLRQSPDSGCSIQLPRLLRRGERAKKKWALAQNKKCGLNSTGFSRIFVWAKAHF
jgi:hypothetical protein